MSRIVKAYGAAKKGEKLGPLTIERRAPTEDDVVISIKFAGICHSDIHTIREEWGPISFPSVVGHEIGGVVESVGSKVTKFKVGDTVGVGCFVDSCRTCQPCKDDLGNYCEQGAVFTYASKFKFPHCAECTPDGGKPTQGGYSEMIVVDQNYVLKIPTTIDLAAATPLLCAGITTYSPLKHFGLKAGQKLAIVGMGGLGHMGVKFGKAMGAHVTVISRGVSKKQTSLDMGASAFIDSTNKDEMAAAMCSFDFILNTISGNHDMNAIINLVKQDGIMVMVGAGPEPIALNFMGLLFKRRRVAGSLIGGIGETQEMLNFCGEHGITCDIELIKAEYINEAYERALKADVKYRFVIDTSSL